MNDEDRKLLHEVADLSKENNELLRKLHRGMLLGRWMRIAYWIVILALTVLALYYLPQYLNSLTENIMSQIPGF